MKCRWCAYIAQDTPTYAHGEFPRSRQERWAGKVDGAREAFDDLKNHARKTHPIEYRQWERQAWVATLESYQRIRRIRTIERNAAS